MNGLLGLLRGAADTLDIIPGFDPVKDKTGLLAQLLGGGGQQVNPSGVPPITPQNAVQTRHAQSSAPGGVPSLPAQPPNPADYFKSHSPLDVLNPFKNTAQMDADAGHKFRTARDQFSAQQAQQAAQASNERFMGNAQGGGFTPEQISRMQIARNANPEEFGKNFSENFGFNTASEGSVYSRFGQDPSKVAKTATPIDPIDAGIRQQNADASTMTAEAAMLRAKNPSPMVVNNMGDGVDTRPLTDKPSKDYQRVWDEESGTYRDEVIPGTSTARDNELLNSKAFQALQANQEQFDAIMTNIDAADELIGPMTAGVGSYLEGVRGTPARNLSARMETVKANIGFDKLNEMRQTSPTGGALGQVTERELNFLQSVRGSLDEGQSPAQLRETLGEIKASLQRLQEVREIAFKLEQQNAAEGQIKSTDPLQGSDLPQGFMLQGEEDLLEFMTPEERALFEGGAQ